MQAPASRMRAAAANPVTPARVRKVSAPRPARYGRPRAKSCGGEACRSSSVTAADARLQRAYARAERAGVSIDELDRYHERWTKLDPEASRQPGMVTASYDAMAVDLNRLAAQRQAAPAPHGPPPSRSRRTEVAALWR
jgi:hypothetical protein